MSYQLSSTAYIKYQVSSTVLYRPSINRISPISLCPCLGKLVEKILHMQLTNYLSTNNLQYSSQHGFISGRCTITNMLSFDATIATTISKKHPYNIISINFKKAFDKVPHQHVLNVLVRIGIRDNAFKWFETFFHGPWAYTTSACW